MVQEVKEVCALRAVSLLRCRDTIIFRLGNGDLVDAQIVHIDNSHEECLMFYLDSGIDCNVGMHHMVLPVPRNALVMVKE